jgi:hypothetical protein
LKERLLLQKDDGALGDAFVSFFLFLPAALSPFVSLLFSFLSSMPPSLLCASALSLSVLFRFYFLFSPQMKPLQLAIVMSPSWRRPWRRAAWHELGPELERDVHHPLCSFSLSRAKKRAKHVG